MVSGMYFDEHLNTWHTLFDYLPYFGLDEDSYAMVYLKDNVKNYFNLFTIRLINNWLSFIQNFLRKQINNKRIKKLKEIFSNSTK